MNRMDYDDDLLRKADRVEIANRRIQTGLWAITAIITFATIAQVWVAMHTKPQSIIVPAPIVNVALPPMPAPIVNVTIPRNKIK